MRANEKEHIEHLVARTELVLNIYELLLVAIFLTASLDPITSPSLLNQMSGVRFSNMDAQFQQALHLP